MGGGDNSSQQTDPQMALGRMLGVAQPGSLPSPPYQGESAVGRFLRGTANEFRQGVLSDEDIAGIKRDPFSLGSLGAYMNAAIMLSRGAGGKGAAELPRGAVPHEIWSGWKEVAVPITGSEGTVKGAVRVDPAGNYYEEVGRHMRPSPAGYDPALRAIPSEQHVIVQPVEGPAGTFKFSKPIEPSPPDKAYGTAEEEAMYDKYVKGGGTKGFFDWLDDLPDSGPTITLKPPEDFPGYGRRR